MKQRFRLPPSIIEKYEDELCFMVEKDLTCIGEVEPRVKFIDPMSYEVSEHMIEGCAKPTLELERDEECPKWDTYEEKLSKVKG